MDPMTLSAVGAGVSLLARLFAEAIAAGDIDRAQALKEQALKEYGPEMLPEFERVEAQQVADTQLGGIREDPQARGAQTSALAKLAEFSSGEVLPEDMAEQRRAMDAAGGVAARAAGAAEQLAASRGLRRSGLSQALAQQGAQAGAQTAADSAAELAAQRRQRQLAAIGQMGQLGGSIRGQDYEIAANRARAQDALNQFNANMRAGAVEARNRTAQQRYANQMQMAGARNNARGDLADFYSGRANANRQTAMDIGGGVQGGLDTAAGYQQKKPKGGK